VEASPVASDGLVLVLDDIAYGESLGATSKFPRNAIAFKWADETAETVLREIEWNTSRTGLINPVAVFDPVELEGTAVSRASLHNVSILRGLELGVGDLITVYKANMIIPQVAENLTRSGAVEIPAQCPVCGGETEIASAGEVEALYCLNPNCKAQRVRALVHFVSRDAMNIEGLSEQTIEKFTERGWVSDFTDLFQLERYGEEIMQTEGFGNKSF
jgi:DNA ligase (NAD+)